jgi:hypothetical protein
METPTAICADDIEGNTSAVTSTKNMAAILTVRVMVQSP